MKNNLLISLILIFSSQNNFFGQTDIDQLISKMTVEEKVGQMTQLNLGFLSSKDNLTSKEIDSNKIQTAINNYHVGSILNTAGTAYSVNKWHQIISTIQDVSMKTTHKIPILYGIDAIHGATYTKESTLFPHNIGLGASRNKNLAYEIALVTAKETRASGIRWNFDPVLDVGRNPLWPRFCETFGEDPYLVSQMGVQMINGYQNDTLTSITAVSSCMKHFLGYSVPKSGKDRTEAYISDLSLWQKHIPSFKAAIDAGASTIMINSSMINDVPVHSSYELLTELLRKKLGFKGLIVTDWEDIIRLHKRHKIAETPKQAVKIAINAGIDMSMVPNSYSFCEHLVSLVKSGEISENRINESVKRILQLKLELGLFDNPYPEKEALDNFGKPEYRMLALKAARESIVLLKNNSNTLPLSKDKKYLVLGPGANCLSALNGCWSYSWQGDKEDKYPEDYQTILEELHNRFSKDQIFSTVKRDYYHNDNFKISFTAKELDEIDCVLLFLGENAYAESPGNIDDLTLEKEQLELAKKAISLGKKIILVLLEGRPRIINEISSNMDAILMGFLPGSMGAEAIVDVLFGDYNPSGILPFTYPAKTGDLITYDHKFLSEMIQTAPNKKKYGGHHPEFEFGHGLSYTNFSFSPIKIDKDTIIGNDSIKVSLTITNSGKIASNKCIDVFIKDEYAGLAPDVKNLKYFTKVYLAPNQKKEIVFYIDKNDLFYYDKNGNKIFEDGDFTLFIENQSKRFYFYNIP